MNSNIKKLVSALFITLLTALPVLISTGIISLPLTPDNRLAAARIERFMALFFLLSALFYFLWQKIRGKKELPRFFPSQPEENGSIRDKFLVFLPLLPLIGFSFYFTCNAFDALFLVNLDYTGISEALNRSAHGFGVLHTPFFSTGRSGSYLGHHFSPTLFLYYPAYYFIRIAGSVIGNLYFSTHILYGILLSGTLSIALIIWTAFFRTRIHNFYSLLLLVAALSFSVPLWRLILSFHFEILTLPLSALAFLALQKGRKWLFWVAIILWLGVKEDIAVYLFLFGGSLLFSKENRAYGWKLMILSLAYFALAEGVLRGYASGGDGPQWNYWLGFYNREFHFSPFFDIIQSVAWLPLLSPVIFFMTILPIGIMQLFSGHSWHATFYGHYSYTILPFLLLGFINGARWVFSLSRYDSRVTFPIALLILAIVSYNAAGDKETPGRRLPPDPRREILSDMFMSIPAGACLQTQAAFTAQAPLKISVFPILFPKHNPYGAKFPAPDRRKEQFRTQMPDYCKSYFLLIDSNYLEPYYSRALIADFLEYASRKMVLVREKGSLQLFRYNTTEKQGNR